MMIDQVNISYNHGQNILDFFKKIPFSPNFNVAKAARLTKPKPITTCELGGWRLGAIEMIVK